MTITINLFVVGVLTTLAVEFMALTIYALIRNSKEKSDDEE